METYSRIRSIKLKRPTPDHAFGFSVRGGHEHGTGVFVSSVVPKTIAHRQGLRIGDQILRVNGYPVSAAVHQECLSLMKNRTNLHLKVRSVGMLPVREKTGEPLTWKLVEDSIGEAALILEVPVMTRHQPQPHHHSHSHQRHQHSHKGHGHGHVHHHGHAHAGQRASDASSQQSDSRGGSNASELFQGMEGKVYINTSGESGLGCCICKGPPERPGIFVQSTKSNGVAREAGLRPGDQILYCNGHSFHNIPFAEAVQHLKASKHLNLSVLKGAASDLFPGESSGYNSSASSLNGEAHNLSVSSGSHLTTTVSSSSGDENSIHSEVVVEQNEPPKRLSVVNEEQQQQRQQHQSHAKDHTSAVQMKHRSTAGLALDRNMEWDEVEQVWHSAEKESLIIEIKGENGAAASSAKVSSGQARQQKDQQHAPTQQEISRLAEERRKLEQEQRRLQEEANSLEEEKRKFEEEKRQAALMIMNETTNLQARDRSSGTASNAMSALGSVASRTSSSSGKSSHSLHGALTQEILKRNERRENGSNFQNTLSGGKVDDTSTDPEQSSALSELPPAGTVDQKKSLFTAVPIIDDEKRLQHEQLIEEFKRAHRKMFAHTLDEAAAGNGGGGGVGTAEAAPAMESQQTVNTSEMAPQAPNSSSASSTSSSANGNFIRGSQADPERESFRAKRIQKEVEHAKKMIEQRLVGVAKQRLLRIERQHQECRETEREVSKHVVTHHKKKSPPPPPPLPTLVEDCGIEQIEQAPEVIMSGQYHNNNNNNNYIMTAVEAQARTPRNSKGSGKGNGVDANHIPVDERPASPSPDYSNSPSPTPESEMQTREIEIIPDKIVQMTSYPLVYSKQQGATRPDYNRNGAYQHQQQNFNNGAYPASAMNGLASQDEIISGLSRCQLSQRLQNEMKASGNGNGSNGVMIVVNGNSNKYPRHSPGILKPTSRTGLKVTPPTAPAHHLKRYENNTASASSNNYNNNDMKAISFGRF